MPAEIGIKKSSAEGTDPSENIGKVYERGMIPYGGGVNSEGKVAFAVSLDEHIDKMRRLSSLR